MVMLAKIALAPNPQTTGLKRMNLSVKRAVRNANGIINMKVAMGYRRMPFHGQIKYP
jgi:hypothetical protein